MPPSPLPQTAAPLLERTFETGTQGRCRLRVPRAAVVLEAGAENEATVALRPTEKADREAVQSLADALRVRYAEGVVRVEPERPPRPSAPDWRALREGLPALTLHVRVPAAFGADVHAPGGRVEARGLGGPVTLEATGGRVHAAGLTGRLDVHAERCQAVIEEFDGKKCSAHVHGGSLTMRAARAEAVEVESSAARLRLEDVAAPLHLTQQGGSSRVAGLRGRLDARVFGGRIHFTPEAGHAARLHAPGGEARLVLEDGHAADLDLSAHRLDLDALAGPFEGERNERRAEGTLNGGGPLIEARVPGGALQCE